MTVIVMMMITIITVTTFNVTRTNRLEKNNKNYDSYELLCVKRKRTSTVFVSTTCDQNFISVPISVATLHVNKYLRSLYCFQNSGLKTICAL